MGDTTHGVVGRRALVHAAVITAWTAPLVLTSVPAYATTCSGGATTCAVSLIFVNKEGDPSAGPLTYRMTAQLRNQTSVATTLAVVTLSFVAGAIGFSSFTFGTWGTVTASPPATTLSLTAPVGETLAALASRDYAVELILPFNAGPTVPVTCTADCAPAFFANHLIAPIGPSV